MVQDCFWLGGKILPGLLKTANRIHTKLEPFLDFRLVHEGPLVPGVYVDPIRLEFEIGMLLDPDPSEILAPGTPGMSLGTKIFSSKFFSYHMNNMLFYAF